MLFSQNDIQIVDGKQVHVTHSEIKLDVHVLAEATGIVIFVCPCIAKGLKDRIGLDEFVLDMVHLSRVSTALGHILQHILGRL